MIELVFFSVLFVFGLAICFFSIRQVYLAMFSGSQSAAYAVLNKESGIYVSHGMVLDGDGVKSTRSCS